MKDIQNFITEKKEYNGNYTEDDLRCFLASMAFIKATHNDQKLCEGLKIEKKDFDELYEDLYYILDDSSDINSIAVNLAEK